MHFQDPLHRPFGPLVLLIVGYSGSGKTTLMEALIPIFRQHGIRVGTIKHHAHPDFEFDIPGKDSWRHAQAGSQHVIIASSGKIGEIQWVDHEPPLSKLIGRMLDVDLILVEGYHWEDYPKIEVSRKEKNMDLQCDSGVLSAVVTDRTLELNIPVFRFDEVERLMRWIESTFLQSADHGVGAVP